MHITVEKRIKKASEVLNSLKDKGICISDRIDILEISLKSLYAKKRLYGRRKTKRVEK